MPTKDIAQMRSIAKWTPAVKIVPKNHIVSSGYSKAEPFVPEYMAEPEDMWMIMSNSYAKKWIKARTVHKKKILEVKNENEVFLMRRYVIRGLHQKMRDLELKRRPPSRVKIGKKVPFAVRLLPPDPNNQKTTKIKSQQPNPEPQRPDLSKIDSKSSVSNSRMETCVKKPIVDLEELNKKLDEFSLTNTHVHAEQVGRNFKLYQVKCPKKHYHDCDCEVLIPCGSTNKDAIK